MPKKSYYEGWGYSDTIPLLIKGSASNRNLFYKELKNAFPKEEIDKVGNDSIQAFVFEKQIPVVKKMASIFKMKVAYKGGGKTDDLEIARTILQQLGGQGKLVVMTGANNFIALKNGVSFKIKNRKINFVKVILNGKDLYDVTFGKIYGAKLSNVKNFNDVYFDELIPLFEKQTGMYLKLFKKGGIVSSQNKEMVLSQLKSIHHHEEELRQSIKTSKEVEAWVLAKVQRATTDLSDVTHYMDGKTEYKTGGMTSDDQMLNELLFKAGGKTPQNTDSVELKINELYKKSGFINDDMNWQFKLLEMLQDMSVEAYQIYISLSPNQQQEVLDELYEMDNDMGSYGEGDIETSKENLMILLDDAKSGKKYEQGGGVESIKKGDEVIWKGNKYILSEIIRRNTAGLIDIEYHLDSNKIGVSDAILDSLKGVEKVKYAMGGGLPESFVRAYVPYESPDDDGQYEVRVQFYKTQSEDEDYFDEESVFVDTLQKAERLEEEINNFGYKRGYKRHKPLYAQGGNLPQGMSVADANPYIAGAKTIQGIAPESVSALDKKMASRINPDPNRPIFFKTGGNIEEEVAYVDRRIKNLKSLLAVSNESEKADLLASIKSLEKEKQALLKPESNTTVKKRFGFFKDGGKISTKGFKVGDILLAEYNWAKNPKPTYKVLEILGLKSASFSGGATNMLKLKNLQTGDIFEGNEGRYEKP